jgi:dTDP-4-dehydrorhamnose reductase
MVQATEPSTWLFGATSLIGYALARQGGDDVLALASPFNATARQWDWPSIDVADVASLEAMLHDRPAPALVVYAHAVCTVGKCEADPGWARAVNVAPVQWLAEHLPATTRLVYVSSDHVFGDDGVYDERDMPRPISVYGQTRIEAEACVRQRRGSLIVRPGLAVGPSIDGRTGHWDWLRYRHRHGLAISIIADEARSAVCADALAKRIWGLARSGEERVRHVPADRTVARPELARALLAYEKLSPRFNIETRADQSHPHLGRITLGTVHDDALAAPLASVMETLPAVSGTGPTPAGLGQ